VDGINYQRRQYRKNRLAKIAVRKLARVGVEVLPATDMNSVSLKFGSQGLGQQVSSLGQQLAHLDADARQLLTRCRAPCALLYSLRGVLFMQRRDTHHEEFIKVGKKNREELDPLQERPIAPARLGKDPAIERQPGQLAVKVERRIRAVRFRQEFARRIARSFRHRRRA